MVVVESNYRVKPNCQSSVRVGVGVVSWTSVRLGFDNIRIICPLPVQKGGDTLVSAQDQWDTTNAAT